MGQVELSGSLTFGPANGGTGTFPSSQDTVQLELNPSPKTYGCASGTLSRQISSPSSYATLSGVGASDCVVQATTLYFRCDSQVLLRFTCADPAGGSNIVSIVPVQGTVVHEFPNNGYLKLLEVLGSARIEYAVSGLL
jgi:hypothetical protein